jgi:hypothetical protein
MDGSDMDSRIKTKFDSYPETARLWLLEIRAAIFEVAAEESLGEITESLKWGELSYQSKAGSPIRIDWKAKSPHAISVYFNCKTVLVDTFKEIYQDTFIYAGNREIVFQIPDDFSLKELPILELKACLSMALRYHQIKHLPLLGA